MYIKIEDLLVWNCAGRELNSRPIITDKTVIRDRATIEPSKTCSQSGHYRKQGKCKSSRKKVHNFTSSQNIQVNEISK